MNAARLVLLLAAKDLHIEARARHATATVAVLGVLIVAVLALGLGPGRTVDGAGATAILWVAYLFGGILCFERSMGVERQDDAMAGLLLAPIDRGVIFLSKLITNLCLIAALALVVTPVAIILFRFDLSAAPMAFVRIIGLSLVGLAALGTLFSAVTNRPGGHGGLLALLVLPLSLPLVLTSTQLTLRAFAGTGPSMTGRGELTLVAFDVVFLVSSWLAFELVLEP
jgi:heme exporter protein B